jgi:hypothetical protein
VLVRVDTNRLCGQAVTLDALVQTEAGAAFVKDRPYLHAIVSYAQ